MALLSTDPVCFARDANSDLIIPLRILRGIEAIEVLIRCALNLWRDEYYLNRDIGMPMIPTEDGAVSRADAILGELYNPTKLGLALRREILTIPGTVGFRSLRSAFDNETRNLSVQCVVQTRFGDTAPIAVQIGA